jgi:hypothetical protein
MKGRFVPLSLSRRLVVELGQLSLGQPRAVLQGRIAIPAVVAARAAARPRIPWPALFAKAQALAARELPSLRRFYVKLPWPHLHEVPRSVACLVVEREHAGEATPFLARIKDPDALPLAEIAGRIAHLKTAPLDQVKDYRAALVTARLPLPLRRFSFWLAANLGRQVPNYFGSFAISVLGGQGVAITQSIAIAPCFLNYGPIDAAGGVDIWLTIDHRVMDGAAGARAIRALEAMLNGPVLAELQALAEGGA